MILLLCLLLSWPAADDLQPLASLTQATGEVMVLHGQTWSRVDTVPVELFSGDKVATDRGRAEVHFLRDDSTLVLDVGTQLAITEAAEGTAGTLLRRIEILLGDVWFKLQHSLTRKTELVTPTAVGGLRGTEGMVHVESQTKSEFTLGEGELEVNRRAASGAAAGAERMSLRAGQSLHAIHGQPLQTRTAAARPVRPALNVSLAQLPKPRANWRKQIPKHERPPALKNAPPVSLRPHAQPGTKRIVPPAKGQAAPTISKPLKKLP